MKNWKLEDEEVSPDNSNLQSKMSIIFELDEKVLSDEKVHRQIYIDSLLHLLKKKKILHRNVTNASDNVLQ